MGSGFWKKVYEERKTSLDTALSTVKRGAKIFLGTACAEPQYLVQGLVDRAHRLHDVQILHFVTLGNAPYTEKRFDDRFRHNAFFVGPNIRCHQPGSRRLHAHGNLRDPGSFSEGDRANRCRSHSDFTS
jgi:acyl-CoA hydrolase